MISRAKIFTALAIAGACVCAQGQQWYAGHFGGYPVPTLPDSAELPIPQPGSNIRTVSTFTTTNTPALLGDLTGKTISATVWLECSNNPEFYMGGTACGSAPISMRLFFTSDQRPYTEVHGLQQPTAYWWAIAGVPIACGTNILRCPVTPDGWSDALGHLASNPNYMAAFTDAARNVAQAGLSFGGGCFYDNGFGIANEGAAAVLHVLQFDADCEVTPWLNDKALAWDGVTNTGYVIESKCDLSQSWVEIGRVTNAFRFSISATNPCEFFRVGAFNP